MQLTETQLNAAACRSEIRCLSALSLFGGGEQQACSFLAPRLLGILGVGDGDTLTITQTIRYNGHEDRDLRPSGDHFRDEMIRRVYHCLFVSHSVYGACEWAAHLAGATGKTPTLIWQAGVEAMRIGTLRCPKAVQS